MQNTLVETLEFVRNKLLEQGECCLNGFECAHEMNGKHCAVGWLIPEGHAAMASRLNVDELVVEFPDLWFAKKDWVPLLRRAQLIHDDCPVENWEGAFNELIKEARCLGL